MGCSSSISIKVPDTKPPMPDEEAEREQAKRRETQEIFSMRPPTSKKRLVQTPPPGLTDQDGRLNQNRLQGKRKNQRSGSNAPVPGSPAPGSPAPGSPAPKQPRSRGASPRPGTSGQVDASSDKRPKSATSNQSTKNVRIDPSPTPGKREENVCNDTPRTSSPITARDFATSPTAFTDAGIAQASARSTSSSPVTAREMATSIAFTPENTPPLTTRSSVTVTPALVTARDVDIDTMSLQSLHETQSVDNRPVPTERPKSATSRKGILKNKTTAASLPENLTMTKEKTSIYINGVRVKCKQLEDALKTKDKLAERKLQENLKIREMKLRDERRNICISFLQRTCRLLTKDCPDMHTRRPYQWCARDLQTAGKDYAFIEDENYQLEASFCNPNTSITDITMDDGSSANVDFGDMKIKFCNTNLQKQLLRYSTRSTLQDTASNITKYHTRWHWYRCSDADSRGRQHFTPYGSAKAVPGATSQMTVAPSSGAVSKKSYAQSISHNDIERKYRDCKTNSVTFLGGALVLDFSEMTETCDGVTRAIRRRPENPADISLPLRWNRQQLQHSSYTTVELQPDDDEYIAASKLFKETVPYFPVTGVARIQNEKLFKRFHRKEHEMLADRDEQHVPQYMLFHGTTEETMPKILKNGFDFKLAGTRKGARFGAGSYFARDAWYSINYGFAQAGQILLVRVLVGNYAVGTEETKRPPPLDPKEPDGRRHDTCVDDEDDPEVYVVFDNDQVYPEYLITYDNSSYM